MRLFTKGNRKLVKTSHGRPGDGTLDAIPVALCFSMLLKRIQKEGGTSLLDALWDVVQYEIQVNNKWQVEAEQHFPQSSGMERLPEKDRVVQPGRQGQGSLAKFMTESPLDISYRIQYELDGSGRQ